jgi:hypothetical protein
MEIKQPNAPVQHPHGFEKTIAVVEASIAIIQRRAAPAIDPNAHL